MADPLSVVLGAIVPTTGLVALYVKWQSDKATHTLELKRLGVEEGKLSVARDQVDATHEVEFRRDLLALQTRMQETIERLGGDVQRRDMEIQRLLKLLAEANEKIEVTRKRWHDKNEKSQEDVNALQREILEYVKRIGELEKKYEHDMGELNLKIAHLESELEKCLPRPTESVWGESDASPAPGTVTVTVAPREGC